MSAKRTRPALTSPERIAGRQKLLLVSFVVAAMLVVGRAVQLQGFEGAEWKAEAASQQQARVPLPARRGAIYDRDGVPLALTRETYEVAVAPAEIRDRREVSKRLVDALGLTKSAARRATDARRKWVVLPGRFTVEQRRKLGEMRGLHLSRQLERFYPQGEVGREVMGTVSADGRALGGIEQAMDSILRGTDGFSIHRRNGRGRKEAAVSLPVAPPRDGGDVYLTLDFDLQEIADAALDEAIRNTNASGGDLLLTEPRTGEILAAVSRRRGSRGLAAFVEPYEPGSILKPFFVANLLSTRRASLNDQVFAENGRWADPNGRIHTDVHPYGMLSLRDALRVSSNIGMVKMVPKLRPAEQYANLRDFGFGTPTGVEYPVESGGRLPRPARWSKMTAASLATGYEVSVTPVQMAMAYGALANHGNLMEAHLLRETRGPDGGTRWKMEPRVVRRAVPAQVTDALRDVLITVVSDGSAKAAALSTFEVAGKTGTARRTGANGRYEAGQYNSSFVSYFPARDPQLVIFVKLDRPQGDYYGGLTAAPVTRATLQAILAARSPSLDRRALLATRIPTPSQAAPQQAVQRRPRSSGGEGTYVFDSLPQSAVAAAAPKREPVPVPELAGLSLRDAVRRLHALGFQVRVQGAGTVKGTRPAAGAVQPRGGTVLVVGAER
ncbi:MAG TPA: penicillin-binding transpeptidase domain-containing protein [Longimicrobium sp.]